MDIGVRDYVVFCSWGNDSVACIQLLHEYGLDNVVVVYSDTGWASPSWAERRERGGEWCYKLGYKYFEIESIGFEELVLKESNGVGGKGRFPTGQQKFCTRQLKIIPAQKWLANWDPDKISTCVVGVRRAESKARALAPIYLPSSSAHGGRALWQPLAEFSDESRNSVLFRAGWDPLPHRSDECNPCIHANREDLRRLTEFEVSRVRDLEQRSGAAMFRPSSHMGARTIDEVMNWARADRGQYVQPEEDQPEAGCEDGFCGT